MWISPAADQEPTGGPHHSRAAGAKKFDSNPTVPPFLTATAVTNEAQHKKHELALLFRSSSSKIADLDMKILQEQPKGNDMNFASKRVMDRACQEMRELQKFNILTMTCMEIAEEVVKNSRASRDENLDIPTRMMHQCMTMILIEEQEKRREDGVVSTAEIIKKTAPVRRDRTAEVLDNLLEQRKSYLLKIAEKTES